MSFGTGFGVATSTPGSAFSFGSTASTAATPVKPGFVTPSFGFNTPATSAPSLFGASSTPATGGFGTGTGFGTPAATGFGNTSTTGFGTTPAFGTTPTSGFGSTPAFGSTSVQAGTGFGSTSTFGSTPASTAAFGGFGNTTTTSSLGFGSFSGFGTATTTSAPSFFGGFGTGSTAPTGFGASTGFGAFGTKPTTTTTTTGFGGFGAGIGFTGFGTGLAQPQQQQPFQQQQQQQLQQQTINTISEALYNAVFNCQLYNDERDNIIARWNLIQALWGTGKAYYSMNAPPIELNQENPLCRFKAIGYSRMPEADNNDGLVVLCFNKKKNDVKEGETQLIGFLNNILGNKPNLSLTIDNIKATGEEKSQVTIFVTEKGITGAPRKIPANELVTYLSQPMQKQQLMQNGVEDMLPLVKLDPVQLKEYLDNPPCSIDPRLWKQAQLDNPNPGMYIPVPMIGFQQVKHRLKCQEEETSRHRNFLDMASEEIQNLQRQHTAIQSRLKEHRRNLLELQHRVLQVLVRQEITRKVGLSLQSEEEVLTRRFETMHSQISAPTQFKGRISEMLSQLRMRNHIDTQNQERYAMDPIAQDDIKAYLSMEQQGMAQLISTIHSDLESLKIIKDGMSDLLMGHSIS
ncbi:PREDICTED: nuclear pore complex protein Nup54-like [Dufourea novaeangliae]|uniref:Putative nucleoporin Nup54 n=1 Tax=Dufourea novaeangliae TaxID=178035 RepID=A0A154PAG5_DUFNO|nr:PREDICTED: nuclear pore complex protein Nup54-like [Dufourea novaeangliae]KZC08218.1 putative nucleoporin Nup54 [Dufourea novaeangliae]